MLVAGNTAKGAYPIIEYPRTMIDISGIPELKGFIYDQNMVIGAGNTLTELLEIFKNGSKKPNFTYLEEFYNHLKLVAHIAVRNLGTVAGNLVIKYQHNEFQSDLFLMFSTVGATLTIQNKDRHQTVAIGNFLKTNMKGSLIMNVKLPPISEKCIVKTYKVMPRSQNAHAIVNFGAYFDFYPPGNILKACRLVFGGLSPEFSRARATEAVIVGKPLFTNETLQSAIQALENELVLVDNPPEPSVAYRKKLAIGLFYKSLLSLCPKNILRQEYGSGSVRLHESRPVSKAQQSFDTSPSLWPLNKPIPKLESLIQCAGEASYTEDIPSFNREVFAELVLSTIGKGSIVSIDPSRALKYPGVIAVYKAEDIPGLNSFTPADNAKLYLTNEEVLCSGEIKYYNQPIAIIVAESRHIAEVASGMVDVTYNNVVKPVVNINETRRDTKRNKLFASIKATDRGDEVVRTVKGSNTIYGQYHFTMETLAVVTRPIEEGLEVYATTQWPDALQTMVSRALNMDVNRIDVHVRRIGGGFGIKVSRIILSAVACSLVTMKLNLPCRIIHSIEKVMRAFGKRFPCSSDYEFAVNERGVFQFGNFSMFQDNGFIVNEIFRQVTVDSYNNCYNKARLDFKLFESTTDTAKNTWFRAPGTLESIAMIEMIMEHISYELSLDSIQVRLANLDDESASNIKAMINTLMSECNYKERRDNVDRFNAKNRWKKRGLRCVPLRWNTANPRYFDVNMCVYHEDGTVTITHGGVEIGQGINTRTAQICAYFLKIPLDIIHVKENNTISSPNSAVTGGSITCQSIGVGIERCCKELIKRLEPIKAKLDNPTWKELIGQAYKDGVDLQVHGFVGVEDVYKYTVYGVTIAEVEIDVLTGELEVLRVDVMSDAGQSISPALDIGQVEGAFIMGLGYWTCENLVYDTTSGELLTNRTWNYYVPQARDIPQNFCVYLRKNSYSLPAILGSKITGEPPICMSVVIPMAIREAITAARFDSGIPKTTWYPFIGPYTAENICMATSTKFNEYKLQ